MATIVRATCRSRIFQAHSQPVVRYRSYAVAATKQKTNKTRASPPPSPRRPSPVKAAPSQTASVKAAPTQPVPEKPASQPLEEQTAAETSKTGTAVNDINNELEQIANIKRMSEQFTTTDIWGAEVATLDVEIPYDLSSMFFSWLARPRFNKRTIRQLGFAINHNFTNWGKNFISMLAIARANAFPEVDFTKFKLYNPKTLLRLANVQSHSQDSFLAPLKEISLHTYRAVYMARTRQKESVIKEFTCGEYQQKVLQTIRRKENDYRLDWEITSDISKGALFPKKKGSLIPPPVTVVSVRALEVYLATEDPKIGNRLVIQALVKFDTDQALRVTDKDGRLMESLSLSPRRVVQYLVLEKVGWYDTPWRVKEQISRS